MSEHSWQRYVHRYDKNDVYEARKVGSAYELRRPGEEVSMHMSKQQFEAVYVAETGSGWGGPTVVKGEPGYEEVLEAFERALVDNPHLRMADPEEVSRQLLLGGYVEGEPSPGVVGKAMATVAAEEQAFGPDVPLEDS